MIVSKRMAMIQQYMKSKSFRIETICFLCAAMLGRITLVEGLAPFGTAFLSAVAISGIRLHLVFWGAVLGSCLIVPIHAASLITAVLFYLAHTAYRRFSPKSSRMDSLIILFIVKSLMLPVFFTESVSSFLHGLIDLCINVFSAFAIQNALCVLRSLSIRHVLSDGEQVSISILFGCLLLAVSDIHYMGFSLSVILLLVFSMVSALARGIGGVAVAVAIGAVLTVGGEFTLMFVGSLAACTLAGAALRKAESFGVFAGFFSACLIVGSYVFTAVHTINLPNLAIAGVLFLMIPKNKLLTVCGYLDAAKNQERYSKKSMQRLRARTADEMEKTSAVCHEIATLYESKMNLQSDPQDAKEQWIVRAACNICSECTMYRFCWQDYMQASESILAMLYAHEHGERIRIRQPFDPSCKHMIQIASAAWQAQNQYLVQHAMRQQTARQYAFIHREMMGICGVMNRLAKQVREDRWLDEALEQRLFHGLDRCGIRVYGIDASYPQGRLMLHIRVSDSYRQHPLPVLEAIRKTLRRQIRLLYAEPDGKVCILVIEEAQLLSVSVGKASAAVSSSGVSGDCTGVRALSQGRMLCVLSDGMGSGAAARSESEAAIRLLFNLYERGFAREIALESVNRLLLEKGKEMYATLDIVHVDLSSGQTEFIKYGAPPTFVYRGKRLHTISSEALPAGIVDEAVPAIQTTKLRRDDIIFLFSDGMLEALGNQTQSAIMETMAQATDSQMISELLLRRAQDMGQDDDMTALVIRIA